MFKKSVKMFETVMVWLLSLCLITQLLLVFKIMDLAYNLKGSITNQTDFITLVTKLSTKSVDLKAIQFLGATNRLFLLILLFVFAAFIVYRVIKKENNRLLQASTVMIWVSSMSTVFYVYITRDVFYALNSITTGEYGLSFENAMYLLGRVQKIIDFRDIIIILLFIILFSTLGAIILNIREILDKSDDIKFAKLNLGIFLSSIILLFSLVSWNLYINYSVKQFNPLEYMIKNYIHNNDDVYLVGSINMKKVNANNIDPAFRMLYLKGVNYEVENPEQALVGNEEKSINVSYDIENKEFLGLKTGNLKTKVYIDKVPKIVNNIENINVNSLFNFLNEYDGRYISKSIHDDITGIYEGNAKDGKKEYYVLEKVDKDQLSITEIVGLNNINIVYKLIYIGVMYEQNSNIVGFEALNNFEAQKIYIDKEELINVLKSNNIVKVK